MSDTLVERSDGLVTVTFTKELAGFSADDVRKIMRDNVVEYLGGVTS